MTPYTYLWEFIVAADQTDEFERHYGAEGSWVQLFRQAPGYIETILLRDSSDPRRFVTIDRWDGKETYLNFRSTFSGQYVDLNRRCEKLTVRETLIGEFGEPTVQQS